MRYVRLYLLGAVFALGMLVFAGCGGGGASPSGSSGASSSAYTTASVTIDWPEHVKSLPYLAESLDIQITGPHGFHVTHAANRPAAGGRVVVSFTKVPVGELTIDMMAYPTANLRGTRLAQGELLLTAHAGEELDIPVSLSSMINELLLFPDNAVLPDGTAQQFTVNARNIAGDWLLLAPHNISWASSDISIATVSESGLVTGVKPGRVLITVTEAESGKSTDIGVTIIDEHVRVQPGALTLDLGESHTFTAQVTGLSSNEVVWSIDEAPNGGTIDPHTGEYTVPLTTGTYHITATSTVNSARRGTATVTVTDAQVQVTPPFPRVNVGHTKQLTATVVNTTDQAVAWSVEEGTAGGQITPNGLYTAPSSAGAYHVIATCVAHPRKRQRVTVVVTDIQIAVTPLVRTVNVGGELPLTATVTGSVLPIVQWQVQEGFLGGQITQDGRYTAPLVAGTYHVIATSLEDPTVTVTIPITVASMQVVGEIN